MDSLVEDKYPPGPAKPLYLGGPRDMEEAAANARAKAAAAKKKVAPTPLKYEVGQQVEFIYGDKPREGVIRQLNPKARDGRVYGIDLILTPEEQADYLKRGHGTFSKMGVGYYEEKNLTLKTSGGRRKTRRTRKGARKTNRKRTLRHRR